MTPYQPRHRNIPSDAERSHKGFTYLAERFRDGEWHITGKFAELDDDRLDRHAWLMTGRVRLINKHDCSVVVAWLDGVRLAAEVAA